MPILKVLINEKGEVVGTSRPDVGGSTVGADRPDVGGSGMGAPQSVTLVARQGQRVIEINVDDKMASLEPEALHAAVKAKYGEAIKTKPGKATKP
jgi:ribosomal protein L16/L10AE